jgi:hypothetical protein
MERYGKLLLISAHSVRETLVALRMRGGKNAFRSLHSFGRQPTFSDVVHRKLVTADGPNPERHQRASGQADN